jgi:hypothetical protein
MTPPETAGVRKAYEAVGRAMVEMTTAVRDIDEWPAIPELWRRCMQERDELRVQASHSILTCPYCLRVVHFQTARRSGTLRSE